MCVSARLATVGTSEGICVKSRFPGEMKPVGAYKLQRRPSKQVAQRLAPKRWCSTALYNEAEGQIVAVGCATRKSKLT